MRRLRGLLASVVGGAVAGGAGGIVLGLFYLLTVLLGAELTVTPQIPGGPVTLTALWGTVVGALSGGVFGGLLMFAERGRGIDELRASRVAMWAAIASGVALRFGGASFVLVMIGSSVGAAIGAGAVRLAKRADRIGAASPVP